MCEICHYTPCLSGCPNAPDPPAAFRCHGCGEAIYPEEEYARVDCVEYCKDCIDNMPYCVLIPKLGGEWKTVQDGEVIKCAGCEEELPPGTEYGVVDGVILCEDCIDEIPYCDIVTRMGAEGNTATAGDIYDGYDG